MTEDPEMLYHYTSAAGLQGIVESRKLWATDAKYLNDRLELRRGVEDFVTALRERADAEEREPPPDPNPMDYDPRYRAGFLRDTAEFLELFSRPGFTKRVLTNHAVAGAAAGPFLACFCESGDLLSQWRGYAAPGGYALCRSGHDDIQSVRGSSK